MRTCKQEGCTKEAILEVFWPGKTIDSCAEHALKLTNLAAFMGFAVDARLIPLADETEKAVTP